MKKIEKLLLGIGMIFSKSKLYMSLSITNIDFKNGHILLHLSNGLLLKDELKKFPKLSAAKDIELFKYELWDDGKWIHWEDLNEDLGLEGFLNNAKH